MDNRANKSDKIIFIFKIVYLIILAIFITYIAYMTIRYAVNALMNPDGFEGELGLFLSVYYIGSIFGLVLVCLSLFGVILAATLKHQSKKLKNIGFFGKSILFPWLALFVVPLSIGLIFLIIEKMIY